jgi:hypothetical protein
MFYNRHAGTSFDSVLENADVPPSVQLDQAGQSTYSRSLARNSSLTMEAFTRLYAQKLDARTAESLCRRKLCSEQLVQVLAKERRIGVLRGLLSHNPPSTAAEVQLVLDNLHKAEILPYLYSPVRNQPELAAMVGPHLKSLSLLGWLSDSTTLYAEYITRALDESLADPKSKDESFGIALRLLLDTHPDAVSVVLGYNRLALVAGDVAQSINLTEEHQAQLLGVEPEQLCKIPKINPVGSSVAHHLVRNPVATPRVLLAIEKTDPTSVLAKDVKKRERRSFPTLNPGFAGISTVDADRVAQLLNERDVISKASYGAWRTSRRAWLALLSDKMSDAALQSVFEIQYQYAWSRNVVGPVRFDPWFAKVKPRLLAADSLGKWKAYSPVDNSAGTFTDAAMDEAKNHVASKVAWPSGLAGAVGNLIASELGDDPQAWAIYADQTERSGDMSVSDLLRVVNHLRKNK